MTVRPNIANAGAPTTVENADVTVVGGAGHVGVPLVLALAEAGLRVNINDLNKESLDTLEGGRLPFIEYGAEGVLSKALINRRLVFTHSSDRISPRGPVIITIGTPISFSIRSARWCKTASMPCCRRSPTASSSCCAPRYFPAPRNG